MIIKVSGLREAEKIREVSTMGVGMMAFDFRQGSERFVRMISSQAGIIPDYSEQRLERKSTPHPSSPNTHHPTLKVGIFADDMPQSIITRIYNYELDAVQLDGNELPVMIDNLRRSAVPDICPQLTIIKTLHLREAADIEAWKNYEHHADMLLFEIEEKARVQKLISQYHGTLPFLVGCAISPDDVDFVKTVKHPLLVGIDLNEGFELSPAVKDLAAIRAFVDQLSARQ